MGRKPQFPSAAILTADKIFHTMSSHDVWQRFKITATKYTEEGRTLAQAAALSKVNIDTLIDWKSVMRQPESVKRSHIDERSQQLFALKRSTCAQ